LLIHMKIAQKLEQQSPGVDTTMGHAVRRDPFSGCSGKMAIHSLCYIH
jgi:hypothetical protein